MNLLLAFVFFAIPPFVTQAFDNIDAPTGWAFTQTTVQNGLKTVESFDPSRPEGSQWRLITFEGHAPTAKDLETYQKEHAAGSAKKSKAGKTFTPGEMIRDGSLTVLRETPAEIIYNFTPKMGDDEPDEIAKVMAGRLTIRKAGPSVAAIEMYNTKPIAPGMSVRMSKFEMTMRFAPPEPNAKALPTEVRAVVKGRVLLVKSIDVDSVVTFSDYRYVGKKP